MADFNAAITKTLVREGGSKVTNVANDKGGLTKYGITKASYPNVDVATLTEDQAKDIYRRDYWNPVKGDSITSQIVAESIFDTAVNMGPGTAVKLAQATAGVKLPDGISSQSLVDLINGISDKEFMLQFTIAKISRYASICNKDATQSKFLLGWINRTLGAM